MTSRVQPRSFTLVELLVVVAIVGLLIGLAMSAVQKARDVANRAKCANNLRQVGLALHEYHGAYSAFPAGVRLRDANDSYRHLSWLARVLPYVEQDSLWYQTVKAFQQDRVFVHNPPHVGLDTVIALYICPADGRIFSAQTTKGYHVAFTSYLGCMGTNLWAADGMLYQDSHVRLADVLDGTSQTILAGERPPSTDLFYGWWYGGIGQLNTGSCDMVLGVREWNDMHMPGCTEGPYHFQDGRLDDQCSQFHYWSLHSGGGNFLFVDGAVRFMVYTADSILPALATRNGGEPVELP
jgi:prepilin-type processing-associated H-X9-DG protein/prepilin-type N-terminal cleavage/methylation domain-containing protein